MIFAAVTACVVQVRAGEATVVTRFGNPARVLLEPAMYSGWGVRTVSEHEARYNPMSYHDGSVWPHDNGLIALGLARHGFMADALALALRRSGRAVMDRKRPATPDA